jgi:hypothetical protein
MDVRACVRAREYYLRVVFPAPLFAVALFGSLTCIMNREQLSVHMFWRAQRPRALSPPCLCPPPPFPPSPARRPIHRLPDLVRAARYFAAAAHQGEPNAMSVLAKMHVAGAGGVEHSNATALRLFGEAAKKAHPAALNGLGFMHLHGFGTPENGAKAAAYFKQAAELGWVPYA